MRNVIEPIITEAGSILKQHYYSGMEYSEKSRHDLVTELDLEIEELIIREIRYAFPNDSFYGEESGHADGSSGNTWIIDPIDGTTNFIMGKPYFAVSIAKSVDQRIVEAYVYNPISDELYFSSEEAGQSFLNNQSISVSRTTTIQEALVVFGFSAKIDTIKQYFDDWQDIWQKCRKGVGWVAPALTLCNVARGRIDLFIDSGASMEGQVAGAFIVKNAGGRLANYNLHDYEFSEKGIIAFTPGLAPQVIG